jgi:hypothetical protein
MHLALSTSNPILESGLRQNIIRALHRKSWYSNTRDLPGGKVREPKNAGEA